MCPQLMDSNPEIAQLMNNPAMLRQSMQMATNPELMQQQARQHDQALNNIQSHPGDALGFCCWPAARRSSASNRTSLIYIALIDKRLFGYSPWRPDAVISTIRQDRECSHG